MGFDNPNVGSTIFEITKSTDREIVFKTVKDDSYLNHYMTWNQTAFYLEPIDGNNTKLTVKINFYRNLDPLWYFGPLQTRAVILTAESIINYINTFEK